MNKLEQLKTMTTVVADTGEVDAIKQYQPQDATTNPSLLYKVAQQPEYAGYLSDALTWASQQNPSADAEHIIKQAAIKFGVNIGQAILDIVPGYVSTEVDSRLSFDTEATLTQAREIIALYEAVGVSRERILIKIASTWEGIKAAETLEQEGIHCNLTLLFGFTQAVACAEAKVTLISPFVGRILDWYKQAEGRDSYPPAEDPGVVSVTRIYNYYKQFGYNTIVMGASFRNTAEIEQLAGCDRLTISPQLMTELQNDNHALTRQLSAESASTEARHEPVTESVFRWALNQDPMATEKLAEGIRKFAEDQVKLEALIATLLETELNTDHAGHHQAVL